MLVSWNLLIVSWVTFGGFLSLLVVSRFFDVSFGGFLEVVIFLVSFLVSFMEFLCFINSTAVFEVET